MEPPIVVYNQFVGLDWGSYLRKTCESWRQVINGDFFFAINLQKKQIHVEQL